MKGRLESWIAAGWRTAKRKPVKNQDLWRELVALRGEHTITWHWVRGHGHDAKKYRCAELASLRGCGGGRARRQAGMSASRAA